MSPCPAGARCPDGRAGTPRPRRARPSPGTGPGDPRRACPRRAPHPGAPRVRPACPPRRPARRRTPPRSARRARPPPPRRGRPAPVPSASLPRAGGRARPTPAAPSTRTRPDSISSAATARDTLASMATLRSARTPPISAGISVEIVSSRRSGRRSPGSTLSSASSSAPSSSDPSATQAHAEPPSCSSARPPSCRSTGSPSCTSGRPPNNSVTITTIDTYRHARVRQVERGPVVQGDEVGHLAAVPSGDALAEVPERTAEHQAGADGQRHRLDLGHDHGQDDHADAQEHRHRDGPAAEQREGEARVEGHREPERAPDVPHVVEMVEGDRGGHPIRHQHDGCDGKRQYPGSGQRRDSPPLLQATQSRA